MEKISLRARFIFWILRKLNLKGFGDNQERVDRFLAKNRANGPALPGRWLRRNCDIVEHKIDGHLNFELIPRNNGSKLHIFYLHGGGYAIDITPPHWMFLKKLVKRTGASLSVPIYPLSPENKWDQSYPMVVNAYEQAVAKYGAENIVVMGDSAGGGYSLGLSQMLRDQGKPLPRKVVLLSPYIDLTAADPMQLELEKTDVLITVKGIRDGGLWWARKGEDPASFPVSPLFHPINDLPPIQLFAGTAETLYSDALRLKKKGDEAGTSIQFHEYDRMQHVWMLIPIPEGKRAINKIDDFIGHYIFGRTLVSSVSTSGSVSRDPWLTLQHKSARAET